MEGLTNPAELAAENERLRRRLAEVERESQRLAARLEEMYGDSEARFAAIFRDASIGILLADTAGKVLMANAAAARILGQSQTDLLGGSAFAPWGEDRVPLRELVRGSRARFWLETQITRPDATRVWTSLTVSMVIQRGDAEYALVLFEDVTERREAEENARRLMSEHAARVEAETARRRISFLAEASAALSASLDVQKTLEQLVQVSVPILGEYCLVDLLEPDGSIRRVTEAALDPHFEAQLRQLPHEPLRRSPTGWSLEVIDKGRTRLVSSLDGSPLEAEANDHEYRLLGGFIARPTSLLLVPLKTTQSPIGALVFGSTQKERAYREADITLAEEFARRAALAIENARLYHEAKEANRLKDDFLAVVSHELRTPLQPILGWARLLRQGDLDEGSLQTGLQAIERNAKSQAKIVEDLLDVSRIITGKLLLDAKPMALVEVVDEAVESLRPAAKAKGITLFASHEATPCVLGDATRISQVVWNLVSNAIKFTPSGGQIRITVSADPLRALLEVADTGQGIPQDFLGHVFERFRQAEAASTRRHGGLGLGLAIVRHLVELHGGSVTALSAGPGQGATFQVALPLATATTETATALAATPAVDGKRLEGVKVVLVDDQPDALRFLQAVLEAAGAEVRGASSARGALELVRTFGPDVVISDLAMPGEDGHALVRALRALPEAEGGKTPAVALSAFARPEDRVRALSSGFQSHLAKPVDPAELAAVIATVIEHRPRPGPEPRPRRASKRAKRKKK